MEPEQNVSLGGITTPPIKKSNNWKKIILILIVLLIISIAGQYFLTKYNKIIFKKPVVSDQLPENYSYKVMQKEQYPTGFPKEVILTGGKATWIRAEDTVLATGKNYKIVEVSVPEGTESIAELYKSTLIKQGWTLNISTKQGDIQSLTFDKTDEQLMVTILPENSGSGSRLSLTYIQK